MYCKHCGKQIAEDSAYCQYCGGKQDTIPAGDATSQINSEELSADNDNPKEKEDVEVSTETKGSKPIDDKVSKNKNNKNSIIANEIVANLKMIGWASTFFAVYMIGFTLFHLKDITTYDLKNQSSFLGESCYDGIMVVNGELSWEEHYYKKLYYYVYNNYPSGVEELFDNTNRILGQPSEKHKNNISFLENLFNKEKSSAIERLSKRQYFGFDNPWMKRVEDERISAITLEELKKNAKRDANRDIEDWNFSVNEHRKYMFTEDLKQNALYAALVCFGLAILGRYIIKLVKWVNLNKS